MNAEMIVVKQLPVIEQQLQVIKTEVTKKVEDALSLVCTEDTVKDVKKVRAELNKELTYWEDKRKQVKKEVLAPYNAFESVYKDCISNTYNKADKELKSKIDTVEKELKASKTREVLDYFNEYLSSVEAVAGMSLYDFVLFENANINVTLSASLKSLKEKAKDYIDRICDDLNLISTQEHKDEILYEYKNSLNVSSAITSVTNRYKAIEEAKAREEERKAREQAMKEVVSKVDAVIETVPKAEPIITPLVEVEQEKILTLHFTVKGSLSKLRELKAFLNENNYDYE
jgi:hypothetical protein